MAAIIYNVTTKVDHSIVMEWLQWMEAVHNPAILATGCFTHAVTLRMIETDDTEGRTYATQYHASSRENYNQYIVTYAAPLRDKSLQKWGDRIISFNSALEVVK